MEKKDECIFVLNEVNRLSVQAEKVLVAVGRTYITRNSRKLGLEIEESSEQPNADKH